MSRVERPKIEVVRVSSMERAKMLPLLEGGVQLQARFKHHLSNNYASCSSLDDAHHHLGYDGSHMTRRRQQHLATKSCDNILARQQGEGNDQAGPYTWRDTTRSEEQLCPDIRCRTLPVGEATKSDGHIHQITRLQDMPAPLHTRFRLFSLLKKLSPKSKRSSDKAQRARNAFPWVVVEFSSKDLAAKHERPAAHPAGRCNSQDSTASDKSFMMSVKINRLRKQQALACKLQAKEPKQPDTRTPPAPAIVIALPSPNTTLHLVSDEGKSQCRNSFARGGDAGKVESPPRPDSLRLLPGQSARTSLSHYLAPDRVQHRMASLESIGSCSLDVEVTASEASEYNEDSASERTLRSLSLLTKTPDTDGPCKPTTGGASTPEYVKRTARLFEPSPSVASDRHDHKGGAVNGNGENPDSICEKVLTNGTAVAGKKPSYLGLACSISGYSGITTYDSKLREGFRSRDQSPGRLGLIGSREVSPLRPGSDRSEGFTIHSECGNFLVPPTKGIARFVVPTPSSVSEGFIDAQKPCLISDRLKQTRSDSTFVNGVEKFAAEGGLCSSVKEQNMGDKSTVDISPEAYMKNGSSEISQGKLVYDAYRHRTVHKEPIPRESLSDTIATMRESSRHFMSSMLSSSSYSALSSESPVDRCKADELKCSPTSIGSQESLARGSPDMPKTDVKDSLGAPLVSPLKRSPGAVRVVEFTSQTKSYVQTVSSSSSYSQTSCSSSQGVDSSGSQEAATGSLMNSVNACKSFIQQRVERLYGPGALAQGFFIRTKSLHRDDEQVSDDVPDAEVLVCASSSSPALPVLRHLRPEFRAQLSVAVPAARRQHDEPCHEGKVTVIPVHVEKRVDAPVLQQQVSVESVTDLQPAAPEVVLPIDQPQVVPSQDAPVSLKDGHYFLNLLKQELERLDKLAGSAEADLEGGQDLPEEVLGKLRAAAGQARLLMRQKMQQFEGLCHKNLVQSSNEQFPTTSEDLAGFWDMVMLQVEQVNGLFAEISELRANNWLEQKPCQEVSAESSSAVTSKRQSTPSKKVASKPARQEISKHAEAARKAREEARRKMMEQRRKAMRDKAAGVAAPTDVEIFVPLENGNHV